MLAVWLMAGWPQAGRLTAWPLAAGRRQL